MAQGGASSAVSVDGTATFLFTNIEGSTRLWDADAVSMSAALAEHDRILRAAIESAGGTVFKHTGDGMAVVFLSASSAVTAALCAESRLPLPVRMGLHTGIAERRQGDWFGPAVNLAVRVTEVGHGGQVLVSSATAALLGGGELADLGEYRLKGFERPERLYQVGAGSFTRLRASPVVAGNLPEPPTPFLGRGAEVDQALGALTDGRFVTLTGVGGVGKTRLALELGHGLRRLYPDGCWFADLSLVAVPGAVPTAIAAALSLVPTTGLVIDELVSRWRSRRALLIVDNCEHVLPAAADAVDRLLEGCADLTVLATSREPLALPRERLLQVGPLSEDEAEAFFVQRARSEAPGLVIDDVQARAVRDLCRRLDGLPLALELAAGRARLFTPLELIENLEERFGFLVDERPGRRARHQTLRGAVDWSYELCTAGERAVFDRLSVFQAPFDRASATAMVSDVAIGELDFRDVLARLVDRSLLQRVTAFDGTSRFRMLETLREYGREHLEQQGIGEHVRARHASHIAQLVGALSLRRVGPDEAWVHDRELELLPDVSVVLEWLIERRDWDLAFRAAQAGAGYRDHEADAMIARVAGAIRASGDQPGVALEVLSAHGNHRPGSDPEVITRCWRAIREGWLPPPDREGFAPELYVSTLPLSRCEAVELFDGLVRYRCAPVITRLHVEWAVIRGIANSGWLDLVEAPLARFDELVASTASAHARVLCADLHGTIARRRGEWTAAAEWYGRARSSGDLPQHSFLSVICSLHHVLTRSLAGQVSTLAGDDLREPWVRIRDHGFVVLEWFAATSTAIAVACLGRPGLAARLLAWFASDADDGGIATFRDVLAEAGLVLPPPDPTIDFTVLADEVLAVADELDVVEVSFPVRSGGGRSGPGLSSQELAVCLTVGTGRTTREAAAELFVSPKTIEFHLTNAYRKLGITNRTQLANLVGQGGLAASEAADRSKAGTYTSAARAYLPTPPN